MEIGLDLDGVRDLLARSLRATVEWKSGELRSSLPGDEAVSGPTIPDVEALLRALADYSVDGEAAIHTGTDLEVLVRLESASLASPFLMRGPWPIRVNDADQRLTYTLGHPSDGFLLFIAHRMEELAPNERFFLRRRGPLRRRPSGQQRLLPDQEEEPPYTVFSALRDSMPRLYTLRIQSDKKVQLKTLKQAADAFAFQVAYNLDTAFVTVRSLEEVVRRTRLRRLRRARPDELEPPRRRYGSDLVYHYQMAVATDSIALEYLSYYHVAEHFFESVFEDDLIGSVRNELTQPGFSSRRKQDVRGLVKLIQRRLRFQREDVTFSEAEALRLVLTKYVDLDLITEKLDAIQESLVGYYAEHVIEFANGKKVDLRSDDADDAIAALSRRVYSTRNSVVHSKEGGRPRYLPFRHDRELAQELPLLRLIAEEIIIYSATALPS